VIWSSVICFPVFQFAYPLLQKFERHVLRDAHRVQPELEQNLADDALACSARE